MLINHIDQFIECTTSRFIPLSPIEEILVLSRHALLKDGELVDHFLQTSVLKDNLINMSIL